MKINTIILKLMLLFALAFTLVACEPESPVEELKLESGDVNFDNGAAMFKSASSGCSQTATLYAGQNIDVGNVIVNDDGTNIYVDYYTENGWVISETHLYVGPEDEIPSTKSGNIKIGHFPDSGTGASYVITKDPDWGDCYVIAAHAVVEYLSSEAFLLNFPTTANVQFSGGTNSYLDAVITNGGLLNGSYSNWCVDVGNALGGSLYYNVNVYSTFNPVPAGIGIDNPQNLDLVNWLINQDFIGQASAAGGAFTLFDIQQTIWTLVDNTPLGGDLLGLYDANRVAELVSLALANGEGFIPGCDEYIAIVLQPVGSTNATIAQVTISEFQVLCGYETGEETAWAQGSNYVSFTDSPYYGGNRWGWYFAGCECTQALPN
jgi:hypothetical protein